jgi:predicted nuclease with TOPRIM domain
MNDGWVLVDREVLLAEMQQVFDARTAGVMLHVLDRVVAQVRQAGVTREDFRELKQIVAELAEAQQRTAEETKKLAVAQARTEERVAELAMAQTRTERALERLSQQVGGLSETVGGDIEDIAYIVLHDVLKREFGWQVGVLEREWQTWDGEPEEVNVFGEATDPSRPGQVIWIVGEAKHNLTQKEVDRFVGQVERARRHLVGEIFAVCFCDRARPEVQQQVRDAGIRLVFSYGKLV